MDGSVYLYTSRVDARGLPPGYYDQIQPGKSKKAIPVKMGHRTELVPHHTIIMEHISHSAE